MGVKDFRKNSVLIKLELMSFECWNLTPSGWEWFQLYNESIFWQIQNGE